MKSSNPQPSQIIGSSSRPQGPFFRFTRPDFEPTSYFALLSGKNQQDFYIKNLGTESLLKRFQEVQAKLMIEKAASLALTNMIGLYIFMKFEDSNTKRTICIALTAMMSLIFARHFSSHHQTQHDKLLVELYNRYRCLTISGPEATHQPLATDILAAIHAELSLNQMEPWRNSNETTDYTQVSDMYRQIRAIHFHQSTADCPVRFFDRAFMNLTYYTSLMRNSELKDHQLAFKPKAL